MRDQLALTGLLRWNRYCQAEATLGAAAAENVAAARGGHPSHEPMGPFAPAIVRLISPFHQ